MDVTRSSRRWQHWHHRTDGTNIWPQVPRRVGPYLFRRLHRQSADWSTSCASCFARAISTAPY